jgi:hypothetical protein
MMIFILADYNLFLSSLFVYQSSIADFMDSFAFFCLGYSLTFVHSFERLIVDIESKGDIVVDIFGIAVVVDSSNCYRGFDD